MLIYINLCYGALVRQGLQLVGYRGILWVVIIRTVTRTVLDRNLYLIDYKGNFKGGNHGQYDCRTFLGGILCHIGYMGHFWAGPAV